MHEIEADAMAQIYDDELPDSIKGTEDGI